MLQVLRLDVSKVDRHVRSAWKAEGCPSGVPAQATFRWRGPSVGVGDVATIERHPDSAGPRVDMRNGGGN
jgi:hypothetical protein